jgi:hypothetical protein
LPVPGSIVRAGRWVSPAPPVRRHVFDQLWQVNTPFVPDTI